MRATASLVFLLLMVAPVFGVSSQELEAEARKIEELLMAPCCGATTLALHDSGLAQQTKREIREMLAAGKARQEILDHYVAQFGNTILSMPETQGFGLLAYLVPLIALIVSPVVVWRILKRGTRVETPLDTAPPMDTVPPTAGDREYLERLQQELINY